MFFFIYCGYFDAKFHKEVFFGKMNAIQIFLFTSLSLEKNHTGDTYVTFTYAVYIVKVMANLCVPVLFLFMVIERLLRPLVLKCC